MKQRSWQPLLHCSSLLVTRKGKGRNRESQEKALSPRRQWA
ncbi:hypothetical protein FQN60_013336 [Etheostoma spectabile]|uniref:Uncharacterized protein n=1 Tax=Etheostoma spectabile TaxID=54343 RepID=A0A5J5DD02_9PERO|nr:hypothetical protein FQN60_013336 [Etheostoma spectabile]